MNLEQVQSFRHLIRNIQNSLVDLSYVFNCKKIDNSEINSLVKSIDATLYSILSSNDKSAKLLAATQYIEANYPILNQIKEKYLSIFQEAFIQLKRDLFKFIDPKTESNSNKTVKNELHEQLNQIFKCDETNPFDSFSGKQIQIEEFLNFAQSRIQISNSECQVLKDIGYYVNSFLTFCNQLKTFKKYRDQFIAGEIPEEIIEIEFENPINLPLKQNSNDNNSETSNSTENKTEKPHATENNSETPKPKTNLSSLKLPKQGLGLLKIETQPLSNEKNKQQSTFHQGKLSLNGLVPSSSKAPESIEKAPVKVQSFTDVETSQYDLMFQDIESKKGKMSNWNEIVFARLEQKTILLQKENQILRENIEIVTRQKMEIQQLYEDHLNELMKQNEFLKQENMRLKENHDELPNET